MKIKKKLLSGFIAVLMVLNVFAQPLGFTAYAFAAEANEELATITTVKIKSSYDTATVNETLTKALLGDEVETVEWEYYCTGYLLIATNDAWGSVAGFKSQTGKYIKTTYTHSSLAANNDGQYQVRVSGTTKEYTIDKVSKLASSVALKSDVSFTYNKDVNLMKQEVFDNVIDWENSTLPAKESLSIDDFTFEYEASLEMSDDAANMGLEALKKYVDMDKYLTAYVSFEGQTVSIPFLGTLGSYPQIGAGEQKIRISFNGNDDYKSSTADGQLTINKAPVKVSVKSTAVYVSEAAQGLNLVTTDPEDKFDITTIYAGITSNVTANIYIQLPDKYTTNNSLVKAIDAILKASGQPTLTETLQNGMTLGELKELLNASETIEALEALGIDTGVIGQVIIVLDKLPSITDNIRIAFGSPNKAGAYTVTAIVSSKNYETGYGLGALLVRAEKAKLVWNQDIAKKITVNEAKSIDFGASIQIDGQVVKDQSSVKVLFTGVTSKFKPYSSSTAPTEAGSYVMTVSTIGGNYITSPITRAFTIKK